MAYIGAPLVSTNFVLDQHTATAGQTAFTMTRTPASAQAVLVAIDGVIQEPGIAYTISGTTLTMTSGVPLGAKVWIVHLGVRGTTTSPADGSVTEDSLEATFAAQVRPQLDATQSLSGTAINFTGIPSWAKKITVAFSGVSTSGTSNPMLQIGGSGGIEATGYIGSASVSTTDVLFTTGFGLSGATAAGSTFSGTATLVLLDASTNTWVMSSVTGYSNAGGVGNGGGSKSLSGTLDRVRLTTVNGTDTFDAGSANILWE
jgi:predicted extracellular nuclease